MIHAPPIVWDWTPIRFSLPWLELLINLSTRHQISCFYFSSKQPRNPIKQIDCNLVIDSGLIDITSKKLRKLDNTENCSHSQFPVFRSAPSPAPATTLLSAPSSRTVRPRWRGSSPTTSTRPWSSTTATPDSSPAALSSRASVRSGVWGTSPMSSSRSRSPSWPTTPPPPRWPSSPPVLPTRPSLRWPHPSSHPLTPLNWVSSEFYTIKFS